MSCPWGIVFAYIGGWYGVSQITIAFWRWKWATLLLSWCSFRETGTINIFWLHFKSPTLNMESSSHSSSVNISVPTELHFHSSGFEYSQVRNFRLRAEAGTRARKASSDFVKQTPRTWQISWVTYKRHCHRTQVSQQFSQLEKLTMFCFW